MCIARRPDTRDLAAARGKLSNSSCVNAIRRFLLSRFCLVGRRRHPSLETGYGASVELLAKGLYVQAHGRASVAMLHELAGEPYFALGAFDFLLQECLSQISR